MITGDNLFVGRSGTREGNFRVSKWPVFLCSVVIHEQSVMTSYSDITWGVGLYLQDSAPDRDGNHHAVVNLNVSYFTSLTDNIFLSLIFHQIFHSLPEQSRLPVHSPERMCERQNSITLPIRACCKWIPNRWLLGSTFCSFIIFYVMNTCRLFWPSFLTSGNTKVFCPKKKVLGTCFFTLTSGTWR